MCVAYPGQVIEVAGGMAVVEIENRRRRASLLLVPEAAPGDWVIVSAGTILEIVDPEEAAAIRAMIDEALQLEAG